MSLFERPPASRPHEAGEEHLLTAYEKKALSPEAKKIRAKIAAAEAAKKYLEEWERKKGRRPEAAA